MNEPKLIRVYPNPFTHVDHHGRPNGHLQYEPDLDNGDAHLRWVGCRVVATPYQSPRKNERGQRAERHDHTWEYALEPTTLPQSEYYRRALEQHDLLPADEETWAYAFGSKAGYVDARARLGQLAEERAKAHGAKPPALAKSAAVIAAEEAAKASGQKYTRDPQAEWDAFVGETFAAHKAKAKAIADEGAKAVDAAQAAKAAPTPKKPAAPAKAEG